VWGLAGWIPLLLLPVLVLPLQTLSCYTIALDVASYGVDSHKNPGRQSLELLNEVCTTGKRKGKMMALYVP
jgi:hypothetical protein